MSTRRHKPFIGHIWNFKPLIGAITASVLMLVSSSAQAAPLKTHLSRSLKSGSLLMCQVQPGKMSLWRVDLASGRRFLIFRRDNIVRVGNQYFYGETGGDDCWVGISSNLRWEVGTNAYYNGTIIKRNVRSGRLIRLPYVTTGSAFSRQLIETKEYTICGRGDGLVYSIAYDGWLYRQSGMKMRRQRQLSSDPESDESFRNLGLTCHENRIVLTSIEPGDGGSYSTFSFLDGTQADMNDFGGLCADLLYSGLGQCPESGSGLTPRWFARMGGNLYIHLEDANGINVWGCSDSTAFTHCDIKLVVGKLSSDFNDYNTRILGTFSKGRVSILTS